MDVTDGLEVPQETLDAEIKSFFESAPPLKNGDDINEKLKEFIGRNSLPSGKIHSIYHLHAIFAAHFRTGASVIE